MRLAGLVCTNLNEFYKQGKCVVEEEGKTDFYGNVIVEDELRGRIVLLARNVEYPGDV